VQARSTPNRWRVAMAGVVMQVALGGIYAWSVFRSPLVHRLHATISQVSFTFTISIFTLGCTAFLGGLWMRAKGPRVVALTGGLLYGLGVAFSAFAGHGLWILYACYGVVGGAGIGLAYIVPIATLVKWFPDRRGFITGVAVAGFGCGALVTAPIATWLIQRRGVLETLVELGVASLVLVVGSALFLRVPPDGWRPAGCKAPEKTGTQLAEGYTLPQALATWQWFGLWAILFLNVSAGISIISQASPMIQEITGVNAVTAAAVVGLLSIANGAGRLLWAWLSDLIGRRWVFFIMFSLQAGLFFALPKVHSLALFTASAGLILLCYGGGFGTMPAFCADYFGPREVGSTYGLMLTAWGCGSALGPILIAHVRQTTGMYQQALLILAIIMLTSAALPLLLRPPVPRKDTTDSAIAELRPALGSSLRR